MRPSLREQAYTTLLDWLMNDRLPKGSITSEGQLCRLLDMSRTPVRAALQQLEAEGFLRIAPKHGILILAPSAQRVGDLLEVLAAAVLFAYEHARASEPANLRRCGQQRVERWEELQDPPSAALAEFEYGSLLTIVEAGSNQELCRLFQSTAGRLYWPQNLRRWKPPFLTETAAGLELLLRSLAELDDNVFRKQLMESLHLMKKTWI